MKILLSRAKPLLFIYALTLTVNIITYISVSSFYIHRYPPPSSDMDFYRFIVYFIEENNPLISEEAFYYSPLFSYLAFLFKTLVGEEFIKFIIFFNIIAGSSIPVVIYLMIYLFTSSRYIGLIIAGTSSIFDSLLIYNSFFLKTTLGIVLIAWGLYFGFLFIHRTGKTPHLILSGLLLGLASLIYVNLLMFIGLFVLYLFYRYKFKTLLFVIPVILAIIPSTLINYIRVKDTILVTSIGGIHFYIGNNLKSNGMYTKIPNIRPSGFGHYFDAREVAELKLQKKLKPSEVSDFWYNQAISEILQNPLFFVKLYIRKIFLTFNYYDIPNNINKNQIKKRSFFLRKFTLNFGIFSFLGLLGFIIALGEKKLFPVHLFFIAYLASIILFFITDRYRLPLFIPMAIYSGFFINYLISKKHTLKSQLVLSIVICIVFLFIYSPNPLEKLRINFEKNYILKELTSKKLYLLQKKLNNTESPEEKSNILTQMGIIYLKTNSFEQALFLFSQALRENPKNEKAKFYLNSLRTKKQIIFLHP
ncbi:hypothetical protein [Persephonella sp.]